MYQPPSVLLMLLLMMMMMISRNLTDKKMLENRPEDALVLLVETVEIVKTIETVETIVQDPSGKKNISRSKIVRYISTHHIDSLKRL